MTRNLPPTILSTGGTVTTAPVESEALHHIVKKQRSRSSTGPIRVEVNEVRRPSGQAKERAASDTALEPLEEIERSDEALDDLNDLNE